MIEADAPAKLNLGLHVLRLRPDGFRDIDTVFVRIPWADRVRVRASDGLSMTCSDPSLATGEGNLCMRAALLLRGECMSGRGAEIHLEKRVPYGAGLGSGSSDAATTLKLLAALWGADLPGARLSALALELGSDVPFFLGLPVARGTGRGEVLSPVDGSALGRLTFVVAVPPVAVRTVSAYAMVTPRETDRADLGALVSAGDPVAWRGALVNDFQEPVASAWPKVARAIDGLDRAGADYTSLSGSGSAVFSVFRDPDAALRAEEILRRAGNTTWVGRPGDGAG